MTGKIQRLSPRHVWRHEALFPDLRWEIGAAVDEVLATQASEDDYVDSRNRERWAREDNERWRRMTSVEIARSRAKCPPGSLRLLFDSGRGG